MRGRPIVEGDELEEMWALRDVDFEIRRGEVVGIIGRNGAGKSTLLKILSRITELSAGRVEIEGRVASLLEVGTGFHPELTGRQNIYLGMTRSEIGKKLDEIVTFAELERFLDTPVKRYSSGMYVRLAFAVAAHLEPEILIVDEVLAVGDAAFQQKCLGKINDVARGGGGRTVLFVSHNMGVVRDLCQRAIFLDGGRVIKDGDCRSVVSAFLGKSSTRNAQSQWRRTTEPTNDIATITELSLVSADGAYAAEIVVGDAVCIEMKLRFEEPVTNPQFGILLHSTDGTPLLDLRTRHTGLDLQTACGELVVRARIASLGLYPGQYMLSPWVTNDSERDLDFVQYCLKFSVLPRTGPYGDMRLNLNWGKYFVPAVWDWSRDDCQGNGVAA
jgi:lipopolysaccharide transport system ATP-binding protein